MTTSWVLFGLFPGVDLAEEASPAGTEELDPGRTVETCTSVDIMGLVLAGQLVTSGPQLVMVTTSVTETTSPPVVLGEEFPPDEAGEELLLIGYGAPDEADPEALGNTPLEASDETAEAGNE